MMQTTPLQHLVQLIQSAKFIEAEKMATQLVKVNKNNYQLWHLLSISQYSMQQTKKSLVSVEKALKIQPTFIPALENKAKIQKSLSLNSDAISTLNKIIKLQSSNVNALYLLGTTLNELQQQEKASKHLLIALENSPNNTNVKIALAQSYSALEQFEKASKLYRDILAFDSKNLSSLNNLGVVLKKQGKWQEAMEHLEKSLTFYPDNVALLKNLASCANFNGHTQRALELYEQVLDINLHDAEAHKWYNSLLWELDDKRFLSSYKVAIQKQTPITVKYEYAKQLQLTGELEAALDILNETSLKKLNHVNSILLKGVIERELNQFDNALHTHQYGTKVFQNNVSANEEFGKSLIAASKPLKALKQFNKLLSLNPNQQGWLACKTTALKMLKSAEYDYFCNYDDFILFEEIECPVGYPDITAFNDSLYLALKDLHKTQKHPLEQSLVNGTQSAENLFEKDINVIQSLRLCLRKLTLDFLSKLGEDKEHPLLSRNTKDFIETDSWSVILKSQGFHNSHFHPQGWFSSPYYVRIPSDINNSDKRLEGAINFGVPGFNTADKIEIDFTVAPSAGHLIQFPSYFWHGTNSFQSSEERVTIPYDIIPV